VATTLEPGSAAQGTVTADDISNRIDRLPFLPFHFRIGSVLGAGTFFDGFDALTITTALTMIVATFHLDYRSVGALLSAASGGQFVGAILFGYLSERFGRKWAFVAALAIFSLCSIGAALAMSVNAIIWARAIQGVGLGAEVPVAAALFSEFVRGSARGRFVMIYESVFVWGVFLAPVAALACITAFGPALGWRMLFAIGGLPIVIAVIAAFRLPESPRWLASKGRLTEADTTVRAMEDEARRLERPFLPSEPLTVVRERTRLSELFRGIYAKRTFVVWSIFFCSWFISAGFSSWAPTLYMKIGGLAAKEAIMLSILTSAIMLVAAYVVAASIDHVGRVRWFVGGFGITGLGALLGAIVTGPLGVHTWPALLVCGSIMGFGTSVTGLAVYLYAPELYPTRMRGWATATGSSLNRIGAFIAPLIVGWIMTEYNSIALVFAMLTVVALFAAIVMWTTGEETKRRALESLSP